MKLAKMFALYRMATQYHSGQWSTGYRISCALIPHFLKMGIARPLDQIKTTRPEFRSEMARALMKYRHLRHDF